MKRTGIVGALAVLFFVAGAAQAVAIEWIWFDEGDPAQAAPAEARFFRRTFTLDRPTDEATLDVTADNQFTAWVNGVKVGTGNDWKRVYAFDVRKHLVVGKNVLAVEARNDDTGPAGLLVRLNYVPSGVDKRALAGDKAWKASKVAAPGWEKIDFDDSSWSPVKVLGPLGKAGAWRGLVWDAGGDDRFAVPAGFRVELAVKNPNPKDKFSLVNLAFDNQGRLLVSREGGPILLCTGPNKEGVLENVKPYCTQVTNCQGMCWIDDALYLVGNGPQGTGLYRASDTKKQDKIDDVKLLHRYVGGMGEHGPHAVMRGPDNWLYLVMGNHSWVKPDKLADNSPLKRWPNGQMGPDQGKPGTTEDVLLPRQNDARGHAANILAPGGTIWRCDRDGKNMSLVAAGFRNHYDAAFSPTGELFTFDSDMEWDEALPWYRAVRVCHCPPGADYVWRTGAANTPNYYIDSLPPLLETGRGSPVGVEFYDHSAFPEKYRGALFLADWSLGLIYAVHLERQGASYKAKAERFCVGNPMNVSDIAVGPDGALYFTLGGRGTQGGVYRIVYTKAKPGEVAVPPVKTPTAQALQTEQSLSAWGRQKQASAVKLLVKDGDEKTNADVLHFLAICDGEDSSIRDRLGALNLLPNQGLPLNATILAKLARDKNTDIRAQAVWLLGVKGDKESREVLLSALKDEDALVRRRTCEALIRAGIEPTVEAIWPLLSESDPFVRAAARLVLQRIDPKLWTERLWKEEKDGVALEGIVALCKTNQAAPYAEAIFKRLLKVPADTAGQPLLDTLRTLQLVLIHTSARPESVKTMASRCAELFPQKDWRANRELAILLAYFQKEGLLDRSITGKLVDALVAAKDDRQQQIHYFYCLRVLRDGWTPEQLAALFAWYESTRSWKGGHSFTPFLANILRDTRPVFTAEDRVRVVAQGEKMPGTALMVLRMAAPEQIPNLKDLGDLYTRLGAVKPSPSGNDLKTFLIGILGKNHTPDAQAALRHIADKDPAMRDQVARMLARAPAPENWPYLLKGLESTDPLVLFDVIEALKKVPAKPKAEEGAPYRAVLLASGRLDDKNRWKAVELLRHWSNNRQFGAEGKNWKTELAAWSKWFNQAFPKEPALPNVAADRPIDSKYKFEDLLALVDGPAGRKGDVSRGRIVFEKAQCLKCHKFGKEGEGIGPDLTTLAKRFKRSDTLEALYYPSKVISDQYRATTFLTKNGQEITGLAAPQGDTITVLRNDGTKVDLKKSEIEQQYAALTSVMPPLLLDLLTKEEIADLFAFMESEAK